MFSIISRITIKTHVSDFHIEDRSVSQYSSLNRLMIGNVKFRVVSFCLVFISILSYD